MVNFNVGVNLTNRLEDLALPSHSKLPTTVPCRTNSLPIGRRENKLAVTMLVTGIYMSESNTGGKGFDTNSMLNSFLQSEINKIAGNALKTIDINFGMETTDEAKPEIPVRIITSSLPNDSGTTASRLSSEEKYLPETMYSSKTSRLSTTFRWNTVWTTAVHATSRFSTTRITKAYSTVK